MKTLIPDKKKKAPAKKKKEEVTAPKGEVKYYHTDIDAFLPFAKGDAHQQRIDQLFQKKPSVKE
jgi:hypothetical protein